MRIIVTLAAGLLLAACTSMADRGQPLELYQETSAAGETLDEFALRIAPRAIDASKAAYAAVCGEVLGTGPYTVQLRTDHRAETCGAPNAGGVALLVNGLAVDASDAHAHIDNRRPGYLVTPWVVKFHDATGERTVGKLEY